LNLIVIKKGPNLFKVPFGSPFAFLASLTGELSHSLSC